MSGTGIGYATCVVRDVRYWHRLCYVRSTRCPVLTWGMLFRVLRAQYAMSGTDIGYAATSRRGGGSTRRGDGGSAPPIVLGHRYALSGTGIGDSAIVLRHRCALSGTDIGDAAIVLCYRDVVSGTDIRYRAMPSLRSVQY
eukprot:3468670-Rhodomonas_salina.1